MCLQFGCLKLGSVLQSPQAQQLRCAFLPLHTHGGGQGIPKVLASHESQALLVLYGLGLTAIYNVSRKSSPWFCIKWKVTVQVERHRKRAARSNFIFMNQMVTARRMTTIPRFLARQQSSALRDLRRRTQHQKVKLWKDWISKGCLTHAEQHKRRQEKPPNPQTRWQSFKPKSIQLQLSQKVLKFQWQLKRNRVWAVTQGSVSIKTCRRGSLSDTTALRHSIIGSVFFFLDDTHNVNLNWWHLRFSKIRSVYPTWDALIHENKYTTEKRTKFLFNSELPMVFHFSWSVLIYFLRRILKLKCLELSLLAHHQKHRTVSLVCWTTNSIREFHPDFFSTIKPKLGFSKWRAASPETEGASEALEEPYTRPHEGAQPWSQTQGASQEALGHGCLEMPAHNTPGTLSGNLPQSTR